MNRSFSITNKFDIIRTQLARSVINPKLMARSKAGPFHFGLIDNHVKIESFKTIQTKRYLNWRIPLSLYLYPNSL